MKVYVLCERDYDAYWIINVFATRELAEQERIKKFKEDHDWRLKHHPNGGLKKLSTYIKTFESRYFIEEYDVIEEVKE